MRSKMEYVMEKDSNGKTQINKVGLQPIQRSGMEYEFTWVIDMDLDHTAVVTKSRAADLADLVTNKPNIDWFTPFYAWLVEGKEPARTKKDFGKELGLSATDIGNALEMAQTEWDPDDWAGLTNIVTEYAEDNQKESSPA
jgi:hypothetical protein